MTRRPSKSRFANKLSTLCGEIEEVEVRARNMHLTEVEEHLHEAKEAMVKATHVAYRAS